MTRDEAIKEIDDLRCDIGSAYDDANLSPIWNALGMAIEALKERKTSKWIQTEKHNCYVVCRCSECDREITVFHGFCDVPSMAKVTDDYPYCHCGAKMEVDE